MRPLYLRIKLSVIRATSIKSTNQEYKSAHDASAGRKEPPKAYDRQGRAQNTRNVVRSEIKVYIPARPPEGTQGRSQTQSRRWTGV